jgi:hypothetical protein
MTNDKPTIGRPVLPPGEAATSVIHVRTTRRRKAAYVRAARPGKLTVWMLRHLDAAAEYDPAAR